MGEYLRLVNNEIDFHPPPSCDLDGLGIALKDTQGDKPVPVHMPLTDQQLVQFQQEVPIIRDIKER